MKEKKEVVRYEINPFLENMLVPIKDRQIKLSRLGKDNNILVNQETGEINGTHITTYKQVDSEQFIKLFSANIALTFELTAPGIKAFNVLIWVLKEKNINKDVIPLDKFVLDDFLEAHKSKKLQFSQATFWRGLAQLEEAKIIAKNIRQGFYFINPNFVFNGDRIAFTTMIEKKKGEDQQELPI